jgi:hypothetical protein
MSLMTEREDRLMNAIEAILVLALIILLIWRRR